MMMTTDTNKTNELDAEIRIRIWKFINNRLHQTTSAYDINELNQIENGDPSNKYEMEIDI